MIVGAAVAVAIMVLPLTATTLAAQEHTSTYTVLYTFTGGLQSGPGRGRDGTLCV